MYKKMLLKYVEEHEEFLFDAAYEHIRLFKVMPYKTYLKNIERLVDDGKMIRISKGIYAIPNKSGNHESVISYYTGFSDGMVVGYAMYNDLELSDFESTETVIYTNKITKQSKHLNEHNITLKYVDLYFSDKLIKIVQALQCIENYNEITDINGLKFVELLDEAANQYDDFVFEDIVKVIKYQYSTVRWFHDYIKPKIKYGNPLAVYEKLTE